MFKIIVEKECGCFKKSDLENNIEFTSKDEALSQGLKMLNEMNDEFCGKHKFELVEEGNTFLIKMV